MDPHKYLGFEAIKSLAPPWRGRRVRRTSKTGRWQRDSPNRHSVRSLTQPSAR